MKGNRMNQNNKPNPECMAVGPGCGTDLTFERVERLDDGTVSVVSVPFSGGTPTTVAVVCPATDDADHVNCSACSMTVRF